MLKTAVHETAYDKGVHHLAGRAGQAHGTG